MHDSRTHERINVRTGGNDGPHILVSQSQARYVTDLLEEANILYSVTEHAVHADDELAEHIINLGGADPKEVQRLLDKAVVLVSIGFVDGGSHEYYEGHELIDRYEQLKQRGLEGKALVHALFSDDWGPPPVWINLAGHRKDDRPFRIDIPYG